MNIRILIPSNNRKTLEAFLASAEASEPGSSAAVIVGDNDPNGMEGVPVERITLPGGEAFNMAMAYNRLAESAKPDSIALFNDDYLIRTTQWLSRIQEFLDHWPDGYGAMNLHQEGRPIPMDVVECMASTMTVGTLVPRHIWDTVGPFDERFTGYGHDDIDWIMRLWQMGYALGESDAVTIHHVHGVNRGYMKACGSYDGILDRYAVNYDRFYEKWKLTPHQAREARLFHRGELNG